MISRDDYELKPLIHLYQGTSLTSKYAVAYALLDLERRDEMDHTAQIWRLTSIRWRIVNAELQCKHLFPWCGTGIVHLSNY